MQVRINNAFLGSVPLVPGQEASRKMQVDVPVPVVNLRPFSNSLSFDFTFQLLKKGGCQDTTPINMQGAILRDTYLDLRGYPHYAPMPNLEIFANAGFPFTRARGPERDHGGSAAAPTEQEIETFVTLMGHFSRQTGFPALRVTVAGPDALTTARTRTSWSSAPATTSPASTSCRTLCPLPCTAGRSRFTTRRASSRLLHQRVVEAELGRAHRIRRTDCRRNAGRGHRRHRVAVRAGGEPQHRRHPSARRQRFETFMATFIKVQQSSEISGSVSVLHGTPISSRSASARRSTM